MRARDFIRENINFYDRFGHDTGPQTLPYTVEVQDRDTGAKKLISIEAVSTADARERARDRGYRVVRVVSQDGSGRKGVREHDGRDDEEEEIDDDGLTMADRARRDGRGSDDEPETAAKKRKRSLQATRDFNRGRRADSMREGVAEGGPFSYGAKKPRKGSVADLADKKRREQERGKQPIEPRDQRVGTARVTKGVAEGKKHISPSGVETTMDPRDDDYDVNYGKNGGVAKFRKSQGLDVRTGSKRIKEQGMSEGVDKQALHQELVKINQLMKIHHPRYHNPNSPGGEKYFELKKQKEAILAQLKSGVAEGIMDTLKGAAREFTRDSMQKKIKQAWENTFWPKHIEPALNRIQIDGQPFRRMVLGEPRVIENDRSKNAILKQYTVNIVFPIDPEQWAGDEIRYLQAQLRDIEDGEWNPKVHGLGLVSFDQPMKSFQYTKGPVPDLVIPVRITSLDINRSLVGEQGVAEGTSDSNDYYADYYTDLLSQTRNMSWTDRATTRDRVRRDLASGRIDLATLKTEIRRLDSEVKKKT